MLPVPTRAWLPMFTLALSTTACSAGGSFQGTVVDGMTGEPRADVVMLAKDPDTSDLTCRVREATTDASGNFTIKETCKGGSYTLSTTDNTLFLPGAPPLTGGISSTGPVELKAWRAPTGPGMYLLRDDALAPVRTFSDVATETLLGTPEGDPPQLVRYPASKPTGKVTSVESGQYLVISGAEKVSKLKPFPLIADASARKFDGDVTITDHVWIGVEFTSDTEWKRVDAAFDPAKTKQAKGADRVVNFVAADALAPGRYALLTDTDKRVYVIDFGGSFPPKKAAE